MVSSLHKLLCVPLYCLLFWNTWMSSEKDNISSVNKRSGRLGLCIVSASWLLTTRTEERARKRKYVDLPLMNGYPSTDVDGSLIMDDVA